MKVHLGYEIGSGAPVEIPLGHLVVSGQTQLSGKTTTLDAAVHRSKLRAVAFVTKRGEGSFAGAHTIPPFYRSPKSGVMWQYVSEVLQSKLGEKLKFERKWIMRVSRGADDLWQVHDNVKRQLDKKKLSEWDRGVFEQLDAYFELVLPELERVMHAPDVIAARSGGVQAPLQLRDGVNVMHLEQFSAETQMLCVASVLEYVYQNEEGVITIIPEAWEMVPQGKNTPVKSAAATMFRKGAALRNFVWFDSQDLAGVDKQALKQVSVWILGVQREENEAKRMIEHLDVGGPKPKLGDVRTLGVGEFFVSFGKKLVKTYVQPFGVSAGMAEAYAKGEAPIDELRAQMDKLRVAAERLSDRVDVLHEFVARGASAQKAVNQIIEQHSPAEGGAPGQVMTTGKAQAPPILLDVGKDAPPVRVRSTKTSNGTRAEFAYARGYEESPTEEDDEMSQERIQELENAVKGLKILVEQYEGLLRKHNVPGFTPGKAEPPAIAGGSDRAKRSEGVPSEYLMPGEAREQLYQEFKARLLNEDPAALLKLVRNRPEIEISVQRHTLQMTSENLDGRMAVLIAEGFFNSRKTNTEVREALASKGWPEAPPNISKSFSRLTRLGFLRDVGGRYQVVEGMKVNVVEAANA